MILVPQLGIETMSLEVETRSPNHWTAREVPALKCFEGRGLASGILPGKNLPGKKDICKGPGVGMSLAFRELNAKHCIMEGT